MTKFIQNQQVPFEEGLRCEFKAFANNPVQQIRDYIDIYVVSFFNIGTEGSIYFGVRDGGEAVGVSLDRKKRDQVRQDIGQKLGRTRPPIHPLQYDIIFHDLFDGGGNPIADRPIVEVKLKPTPPRREVYLTNGKVYIKTPGGREGVSEERLLVLQAEINEELKVWKAEQEQKQREAEAQSVQEEAPSKKKPRQKSAPTPFENPYNSATVATEDMFKGREVEIGHLRSAIETGTHTAIFGLQRMGKTSLVKETLRRVDENCIFAEVDLQAYGGERPFSITIDMLGKPVQMTNPNGTVIRVDGKSSFSGLKALTWEKISDLKVQSGVEFRVEVRPDNPYTSTKENEFIHFTHTTGSSKDWKLEDEDGIERIYRHKTHFQIERSIKAKDNHTEYYYNWVE